MMENSRPWLRTLTQTPAVLQAMLQGTTPDELAWKPAPGRWSIAEVLAHLLDVEVHALRLRAQRMAEEDNPFLPDINQVSAIEGKIYAAQDSREILEKFRLERQVSLEWLRELSPETLNCMAQHEVIGGLTLGNHVNQWAFHDLGHIRQIAELYRACAYYPHTGNYHEYYSVDP